MKLSKLAEGLRLVPWKKIDDIDVKDVAIDSREVERGGLFVCMKGISEDGHDYIGQAAKRGAAAVVCERIPDGAPEGMAYLLTEDSRESLAVIASNMNGRPQDRLKLIGVTGTKGKTSVTYYLKAVLEKAGAKAGLIGTTGAYIGSEPVDIKFKTASTPDTLELYQILAVMAREGAEYVIMEATSHGLDQKRTAGLMFETGIFTNLQHDHLDYHKTFDNYLKAKGRLFQQSKAGIVNADDSYARELIGGISVPVKCFGIGGAARKESGYFAEDTELLPDGVRFSIDIKGRKQDFSLGVPGRFSVYNALSAVAAACEAGVEARIVAEGLRAAGGVRGRFERIDNDKGLCVIVDYAHTPESLENIIKAVKEFTKGRVITLFGCGGDRDREKRPVMGETAGRLSDFCVITSDNPRNESPEDIISDVLPGLLRSGVKYLAEPDRRNAVIAAIACAVPGDAVIIAGKGHETYQEFENRRRIHFDDREVAGEALKG